MAEPQRIQDYQPPDWLLDWIDRVPTGRALDVGAGGGELALWLADRGYQVDALEPDPQQMRRLRLAAADRPLSVVSDPIQSYPLTKGSYALIVAGAVLHFLHPDELPRVCTRLSAALRPGGVLMVEVFTIDDPALERYRSSGVDPLAKHTYPLPGRSGLIHFFAPRELRRLFTGLEVLEYGESRRAQPDDEAGYRAGALLIARRLED